MESFWCTWERHREGECKDERRRGESWKGRGGKGREEKWKWEGNEDKEKRIYYIYVL